MLTIAVIVAVAASFLGVYLSFFIDSAPAPTIVLLMSHRLHCRLRLCHEQDCKAAGP